MPYLACLNKNHKKLFLVLCSEALYNGRSPTLIFQLVRHSVPWSLLSTPYLGTHCC